MKSYHIVLLTFLTLLIGGNTALFAQNGESSDSLVTSIGEYQVYMEANKEDAATTESEKSYYIANEEGEKVVEDLRFVKMIWPNLQVLDSKNNLFFFNENMERQNTVDKGRIGVCGTVPHYTLVIKNGWSAYTITEDETFYDQGNKEPAEVIATISKSEADDVFFINKQKKFNYTSNYGIGSTGLASPKTIIYVKDEAYKIYGDENNVAYDDLEIEDGKIRIIKDGLVGLYGTTKAKYTRLEDFNNFLARFELPNGQKGFVDVEGKEYFDK